MKIKAEKGKWELYDELMVNSIVIRYEDNMITCCRREDLKDLKEVVEEMLNGND